MGTVIDFPQRQGADETIAPLALRRALARGSGLVVLDLRGMREFFCGPAGRLPAAINVPLSLLATCIPELLALRRRRLVLVCADGALAVRAAAQLRLAGFENPVALQGGMELWARLGYPRELPPISRTVA